jgi:hypothetical protein
MQNPFYFKAAQRSRETGDCVTCIPPLLCQRRHRVPKEYELHATPWTHLGIIDSKSDEASGTFDETHHPHQSPFTQMTFSVLRECRNCQRSWQSKVVRSLRQNSVPAARHTLQIAGRLSGRSKLRLDEKTTETHRVYEKSVEKMIQTPS